MNKSKQCLGMVDISHKEVSVRRAMAEGCITLKPKAFKALMTNQSPKGNVFETAKISGIMAAKSTPLIIPLCHPLNLEKVRMTFDVIKSKNTVRVLSEVLCSGKTGVEMEALAAVSAACLTIYDMMKWSGQDMVIHSICLVHKSGGKSGVYQK